MQADSAYDASRHVAKMVSEGQHRLLIGAGWDEIGPLQLDFLKTQGLESQHTLLDVGCGCLRGGVHFIRYLDPANYFGIDISSQLLDVGYETELGNLGLRDRMPRKNLFCTADFDAAVFGKRFDFLLAVSVFTHLNWCRIRLCLDRLIDVTRPGSVFFTTYFAAPADQRLSEAFAQPPMGIITYGHKDPFHYRLADLRQAASGLPWMLSEPDGWLHPRGQRMALFTRTPGCQK